MNPLSFSISSNFDVNEYAFIGSCTDIRSLVNSIIPSSKINWVNCSRSLTNVTLLHTLVFQRRISNNLDIFFSQVVKIEDRLRSTTFALTCRFHGKTRKKRGMQLRRPHTACVRGGDAVWRGGGRKSRRHIHACVIMRGSRECTREIRARVPRRPINRTHFDTKGISRAERARVPARIFQDNLKFVRSWTM